MFVEISRKYTLCFNIYNFNTGFDEGPKMKKYTIFQFVVSERRKGKLGKESTSYFCRFLLTSLMCSMFTVQWRWGNCDQDCGKEGSKIFERPSEVELMDWMESSTEQLVHISERSFHNLKWFPPPFLQFWFQLLWYNFFLKSKNYCSLLNLKRRISINLLNFLLCLKGLRIFAWNGINTFQQSFLNSSWKSSWTKRGGCWWHDGQWEDISLQRPFNRNMVKITVLSLHSVSQCWIVCPGLPPLIFFFAVHLVLVGRVATLVVSLVVVVVVVVVFSNVQFPEKGVGLPPVENLAPVVDGIPVEQQELEELGVAQEVPEVAVKQAPLVFRDQQKPDHQYS